MLSLNRSPLSHKIILFNLLAMVVLVAGVMYLNPFRDSPVVQRERALAGETPLIAELFEAAIPQEAASALDVDDVDIQSILSSLSLSAGMDVFIFTDPDTLAATTQTLSRNSAQPVRDLDGTQQDALLITDFLNRVWSGLSRLLTSGAPTAEGLTVLNRGVDGMGTLYGAASPIFAPSGQVGAVVVTTAAGEIDHLVRVEREQLLQMLAVALLVSIGLSRVLASTIASPLADLTAAAELGRDKNARKMSPTRVRIPDQTGRPDEIGRL